MELSKFSWNFNILRFSENICYFLSTKSFKMMKTWRNLRNIWNWKRKLWNIKNYKKTRHWLLMLFVLGSFTVVNYINYCCIFLGLLGLVGALGYSAFKYRDVRRGGMSTSVFLMQTRVLAQGTVVSCLTVGLAVQMFNKWVLHHGEDE